MKENIFAALVSGATTIITVALGGWDAALRILVVLMVADYLTGVLAAFRRKQVNSEAMFWGGIRKAVVLGVIAIAILLDDLVGNTAPVFRLLALYFYIAREGLSVVENLGLIGVKLPNFIKDVLEQLQQKAEGTTAPAPLQVLDQPLGKPVSAADAAEKKGDVSNV
ncbi:holin family protein [Cohnella sp. GbtcB17]|uniref:phage holin family protein n=1 Tax=Cohnella sp. GbtcB17 TaxID=2824762 RepID=UPI001C2F4AD6|nr:phage holin family protein [Cohnella sp. GbtcB17]